MSNYRVLGDRGMVGSAMVRALLARGDDVYVDGADLRRKENLLWMTSFDMFDAVFLCAAKVGGIQANIDEPVDFLQHNLEIQNNVIEACSRDGKKLIFFGSSCIYPRDCPQPMKEEYLLTGPLEPTNEAYAIAKIAGIKLCEAYARQYGLSYLAVMPCNLYGPNDNFRTDDSHFAPALVRKLHAAKLQGSDSVQLWGSGQVRRELMHVDDLASAVLHLVDRSATGMINIGTGEDDTIEGLAKEAAAAIGCEARMEWDASKPDGTYRKLLDVSRLREYGWNGARPWSQGVRDTYDWYLSQAAGGQQ